MVREGCFRGAVEIRLLTQRGSFNRESESSGASLWGPAATPGAAFGPPGALSRTREFRLASRHRVKPSPVNASSKSPEDFLLWDSSLTFGAPGLPVTPQAPDQNPPRWINSQHRDRWDHRGSRPVTGLVVAQRYGCHATGISVSGQDCYRPIGVNICNH